jgi:isoquinoline 1-oxidoreductase alpha subunit
MRLIVNGTPYDIDAPPEIPLLWALRDLVGLTGTKYGCGVALCGVCTVHVDGEPVRSCVTPAGEVAGKQILTIEGLAKGGKDHPVQQAWAEVDVPQCGYCQSGQIMTAVALLETNPDPSDEEIDEALGRRYCRCATYLRIRQAVRRAAELKRGS